MKCPSCGHDNRTGASFCGACGSALSAERECAKCGRENPAGQRFCDGCGSPLGEEPRRRRTPTEQPSPALPQSLTGGRYRAERFLGEGGRKRVYLAHDQRLARDVAIAIVKTEGLDDIGLARARRESQAMGQLGDHPHIVTIYDVGEEDGQPYIVSQYMAGGDVAGLLAAAPDGRLSVEEAARIGEHVCLALEHAHERGIVHRDIKGANVWLTEDGTAKLGDFGLAMATDRSRMTAEGMMLGTVAYMPPEQALGRPADARSDIYALGALLYEMVAGRPPFVGDDAVAVISQHINTVPVTPSWHNREVPQPLDELILDMLEKAPDDRPPAAAAVRERLRQAATAPAGPSRGLPAETPRVAGRTTTPFVGREDELATLRIAIDNAVAGRGSLRMLVGEPGIGKTRLAGQAGVYARVRGAQPLTGRCYEGEGGLPYMPWVEALRAYVVDRPRDEVQAELGSYASDIAKIVPEVRELVPDAPPAPELEPEQERFRLFDSVSSFLMNASRSSPLLIVLEDLHWADKPSLLLLQHLARRVADCPLLLLGTYRDVDLDRRHPLSAMLSSLRAERLYERVLLRGFGNAEVVAMLEGAAQHKMDTLGLELAGVLQRETEGNPFFIEEIIRHLIETGAIYPREGRWVSDVESMEDLGIPEGIREVIGRRLSRLSESCNRALGQAAVLGREFDFGVLSLMCELDDEALLGALEEALEAQVVVEVPDRSAPTYAFTHALVRETLYDELSLPRKQRLHARAGEALERRHADDLDRHVSELSLHHRLAGGEGNSEKALEYSLRAGAAAQAVFAWEDARGHYEAALELLQERSAPPDQRARLLVGLGDLLYVLGTAGTEQAKGLEYLERALALYEELGDEQRAAQVHSRIGLYLTSFQENMNVNRALEHYRAAEAALSDGPERAPLCYVYIGLASAALWGMRTEEGLVASERALDIAERLGSETLWAQAATQRAYHLWASGRIGEGIELGERAWQTADRLNHTVAAFVASWTRSPYAFFRADFGVLRDWLAAELDKPRLDQAPQQRRRLLNMVAQTLIWNGELAKAEEIVSGFGSREGREPTFAEALYAQCAGDLEEAAELWAGGVESGLRTGDRWTEQGCHYQLGVIASLRGDLEEAERQLGTATEIAASGPTVPLEPWPRTQYAAVLVDLGRTDDAARQCDRILEIYGDGIDWAGMGGWIARTVGLVAAARGDLEEAVGQFERGIEVLRQWNLPWHEADTFYRWGLALSGAGDTSGALPRFDMALDIYRRLGASAPWLQRVLSAKLGAQGIDPAEVQTSIDEVVSLVEDERPDLRVHAAPDGTVTLMFSDIEGSTAINERLGDARWIELLHEHNAIVREHVAAHGGYEVKSQGDGFMVAFASARRALDSAAAIQRAFAARNASRPEQPLHLRIGLHSGEAIREGDDFFGRHVNIAARVAAQARGGEVLVSSLLRELTQGAGDFDFDDGRDTELKGLSGTHRIFSLEWQPQPTAA
jgi:eukaryotic-like serine/threonine-protein kinase